jgi:hypothetical protein
MRDHASSSSFTAWIDTDETAPVPVGGAYQWRWAELFVAIQLLLGLVLFLPGAQTYRTYVRALPYVLSGAALIYYFRRGTGESLPGGSKWLVASLALLMLNLLHQSTHWVAGIAQIVFQLCIAAPAFWMGRAVRSETHLMRVIWVLFIASLLSSGVGILQVYFPATFLPREFSALAQSLNPDAIRALTYVGADGREIIRPPGVSDMPGGAAVAGLMTMILGLALAVRRRQAVLITAACLAAAAVGMTTLYLTHVRSLSILAVSSAGVFCLLRFRQGRTYDGAVTLVAGLALVVGAYAWAVTVGGQALSDRFIPLVNDGVLRAFEENRGNFLRYTLAELIYEFPLGAGLGRWGMMNVLFGDPSLWEAPAIHVEIQPTGWLLDGGIPMWLLYGSAVLMALRGSYRIAVHSLSDSLQDLGTLVFCMQITIFGLCFTGPMFNTQLGILFWAVTGALFGAVIGLERTHEGAAIEASHGG